MANKIVIYTVITNNYDKLLEPPIIEGCDYVCFIDAITDMSFDDAWAILKGEDNAATQYLKRTTGEQLKVKFEPIIKQALESVNATKYYEEMSKNYNKIQRGQTHPRCPAHLE